MCSLVTRLACPSFHTASDESSGYDSLSPRPKTNPSADRFQYRARHALYCKQYTRRMRSGDETRTSLDVLLIPYGLINGMDGWDSSKSLGHWKRDVPLSQRTVGMLDMSATATQEAMPLFVVHTQITVHYLLARFTKINEY